MKKINLQCNIHYCYGLHLQINRTISHASILLLIAGDIATNPGPYKHSNHEKQIVKCLALNAQSLMSLHKRNNGNSLIDTNIERFQNLIYSQDSNIVCAYETWLNEDIKSSEILHSGYEIFRNDPDLVVVEYC